jgi:hypothetical protein
MLNLVRSGRPGLTFPENYPGEAWLQATLRDVDVGSVKLEGADIALLLERFTELDLPTVWSLRESPEFKNYHEAYQDFELEAGTLNRSEWNKIARRVVSAKFSCLSKLGRICGLNISESPTGTRVLRLWGEPIGRNLVALGLVLMDIPLIEKLRDFPVFEKGIKQPITWFTASILPFGTRERPLRASVNLVGTVLTHDRNA